MDLVMANQNKNNTPFDRSRCPITRVVRSVKLAFRYDGSGEEIRGEEILKKGRGACERSIDFGFKMHYNAMLLRFAPS